MSFLSKAFKSITRSPLFKPLATAAIATFAPAALPLLSSLTKAPPPRPVEDIYDAPRGYFPTADSAITNPVFPMGMRPQLIYPTYDQEPTDGPAAVDYYVDDYGSFVDVEGIYWENA
jgi:hypothetical protein